MCSRSQLNGKKGLTAVSANRLPARGCRSIWQPAFVGFDFKTRVQPYPDSGCFGTRRMPRRARPAAYRFECSLTVWNPASTVQDYPKSSGRNSPGSVHSSSVAEGQNAVGQVTHVATSSSLLRRTKSSQSQSVSLASACCGQVVTQGRVHNG